MSGHLYGIHEFSPEWAALVKSAGVQAWSIETFGIGHDPKDFTGGSVAHFADWGVTPVCRLNNAYNPGGTIPLPTYYKEFAERCANFVAATAGCRWWIIGNEPNLKGEWPDGVPITPENYARCYRLCRSAIKRVQPHAQVLVAPIAPYNVDSGDWLVYWRVVLDTLLREGGDNPADGLAIHAYTRSANPADIASEAKMDAPFQSRHSGFRTYRDTLDVVPPEMRHLPVLLTEFNEIGLPDGWVNENTGVVQAMYAEVDDWNSLPGTQKIQCAALYRYPRYDQWYIQGKQGVMEDFAAALQKHYQVPLLVASPKPTKTSLPFVSTGEAMPNPTPVSAPGPELVWDERLTKRGIVLSPYKPNPGERYFKLIEAEYWEEKEHTFVETLDGNGDRLPGVTLVWWWGAGGTDERVNKKTELKPGERWMVDFPMYNPGWSYGLRTRDIPGDQLFGMGLGSWEQPDWKIHISYKFTFMLVTAPSAVPQPEEPVVTTPVSTVPKLVHPVADERYRRVTQPFGVNGEYYSRFKVDGVPLKGHNGIDYGTPVGTPIVAVAGGRVVEVANDPEGYGLYVKLSHSWGESLYAHLSEQYVQVGNWVATGVSIGTSGNTGNSTGPHLHFGLRVAPFNRQDGWGGYTDPAPYLQGQPVPAGTPPQPANQRILQLIKEAAAEFGLDWRFIASLSWHESSWIINATSPAGAMGIMQLMPTTWEEWSKKVGATSPYNERDNIRTGTAYLKWLLGQLKNHEWKAVVAYNFGIGNVLQGVEPPEETVEHANRVIRTLELLEAMGV